jgi:hypothetical protein
VPDKEIYAMPTTPNRSVLMMNTDEVIVDTILTDQFRKIARDEAGIDALIERVRNGDLELPIARVAPLPSGGKHYRIPHLSKEFLATNPGYQELVSRLGERGYEIFSKIRNVDPIIDLPVIRDILIALKWNRPSYSELWVMRKDPDVAVPDPTA